MTTITTKCAVCQDYIVSTTDHEIFKSASICSKHKEASRPISEWKSEKQSAFIRLRYGETDTELPQKSAVEEKETAFIKLRFG
jgi:hypothetical protein